MANFDLSYENMLTLEFNSPNNALHQNKGENGLTFMGIYEKAHPNWVGWDLVKITLERYGSIPRASEVLFMDENLREFVRDFYKDKFWDAMKLDSIMPYRTADLMFKFGVNVGIKRAVKFAQEVVGVKVDGIVGAKTIKALNLYSPLVFEKEYKAKFAKFYKTLADKRPSRYGHFLNGWLSRVKRS